MKKTTKYGLGVLAVLSVIGIVAVGVMYAPTGQVNGPTDNIDQSPSDQSEVDGRWSGKFVPYQFRTQDASGSDVTSGTLRVFDSRPEGFENDRLIENQYGSDSQVRSKSLDSDAVTKVDLKPGTYYAVVASSGKYNSYTEFTVTDGSDVPESTTLSQYSPDTGDLELIDAYSLSSVSYDLGVNSNHTSTYEEYEARETYYPADDSEYRLWKAVVQTGDVDPTTDSDNDGTTDEGIEKAWIEIKGAGTTQETFFNPNNGIDKLGANNKVNIEADSMTFTNDKPMTVVFHVSTLGEDSGGSATDGDELLTDGENPFDINFFDDRGSGNSVADITA